MPHRKRRPVSRRYDWSSQSNEWKRPRRGVTSSVNLLNRKRRLSGDLSPQAGSSRHREGTWWSSLADAQSLLKAFCDNTALHGLRYISAQGMPVVHRLMWGATCLAGLAGAGWLIWSVWLRYATSPTVTVVQDTSYPLYRIPFPAVTVCSVNKVLQQEAKNFVTEYTNSTDPHITASYLAVVGAVGLTSYPTYHRPFQYLGYSISGRPLLQDVNITSMMLRVMPRCHDVLEACFWKGKAVDCCKTFRVQRTEEGFCFAFNSRTAEDSDSTQRTSQNETSEGRTFDTLFRNNAAGATTGLEIFFKGDATQVLEGFNVLRGVNVHIHHPDAYPDVAKGLFVPESKDHVMMAQVSPSQTVSTEEVRAVSVALRRCYFSKETPRTGLPVNSPRYHQDSCFMACRMRFLAKVCNCTPYFFPRAKGVRECGVADLPCLSLNNAATRSNRPPEGTPGFEPEERALDCECLPACSETQYSLESHYIQTSNLELKRGKGYVDVYFKHMGGVRYRKDVMFGWMDLLVSFGGIASLFLGFSLLSGAELLYWMLAGILVCCKNICARARGAKASRRLAWMLRLPRRRPSSLTRTHPLQTCVRVRNGSNCTRGNCLAEDTTHKCYC